MTNFDKVMYYIVNALTFGSLYWIKLPIRKAIDENNQLNKDNK